jgi:hypothetical protein
MGVYVAYAIPEEKKIQKEEALARLRRKSKSRKQNNGKNSKSNRRRNDPKYKSIGRDIISWVG